MISQQSTPPLVYLDHCALMDIAANAAEVFAAALKRKGATLAISAIGLAELADVEAETGNHVEALLRRCWPNVVFLDIEPGAAINRENLPLEGRQTVAPQSTGPWAAAYLRLKRSASLDPLDPTGLAQALRSPKMAMGSDPAATAPGSRPGCRLHDQ